jgi:hypothetical protein
MDPQTLSKKLFIATPCPMKWSQMEGGSRVRHCAACKKSVYNVSEMSTEDVERLLQAGKTACVLLRRRRDGTVVTGDCQQRWRAKRSRARERLTAGVSTLTAVGLTVVILVATVTLFGNNIRQLFGASAGGLPGDPEMARSAQRPAFQYDPRPLATFPEDWQPKS